MFAGDVLFNFLVQQDSLMFAGDVLFNVLVQQDSLMFVGDVLFNFLVQQDSLMFASQIQESVPVICQLLSSKNTSDVFEAIEFFVTGYEFGVTETIVGIRKMLALIWSREASVKEAVVNAYKRLYLTPQGGNPRCAYFHLTLFVSTVAVAVFI